MTAIAGLGSGAITARTTFPEQPAEEKTGFLVDGYRVGDGHHPFTGTVALDFTQARRCPATSASRSSGWRTGGAAMARGRARLGFGAPIPFDLPTAASQLTNGWRAARRVQDDVELANAAYGQGEVLVTPLQMALVAATIAERRRADAAAAS